MVSSGLKVLFCVILGMGPNVLGINVLKPNYKEEAKELIQIDGKLDESAWKDAAEVNEMTEVYPDDSGKRPPLETQIRVLYSDEGLYVGFWCETPAGKQLGRLSFRDNEGVERDWFRVSIDPTGQGVSGYFMELALGGSLRDGTILPERQMVWEWDGPWRGETYAGENGWSGEMFLPWSMFALPRTQTEDRLMGIHFERWVSHLGQRWSWEPLFERDPKFLSGFSQLQVRNVASPKSLVLYPFAAGSNDLLNDSSSGRGGLDVFWNPTPGMRIAGTVLPDFGQVESDELVVNLGAFETFFPEKRAFFLEDRDIYNTRKYSLVHTRRIGSAPDSPNVADGFETRGIGGAAEILAASKLTGQRGKYRFGSMLAVEEDMDYDLVDTRTGSATRQTLAGREFYTGRVLRENITGRGAYHSIGWLGTHTVRPALDRDAQINAVDGKFRSPLGKWDFSWQSMTGTVEEKGERETGFGSWVDLTYKPNKGWRHWGELVYFDDKMDFNDLGFLWRNDQRWVGYSVTRNNYETEKFRELNTSFGVWRGENSDGRVIDTGSWFNRSWHFHNQTRVQIGGEYKPARWDDRISRNNGTLRLREDINTGIFWDSDSRKKLGLFTEAWFWEEQRGNEISWRLTTNGRYTMNEHLDFRLTNNYRNRKGWLLWREDKTFAAFDAIEVTPTLRANILVSPRQDLRLVAQWFAIRAEATEVLDLSNSGSLEKQAGAELRDYDFVIGSLAFQVRYRYEIAPLSDLFVVYSRGGFLDDGRNQGELAAFSDILSESIEEKTADLFLLKFRYRFD